MNWITKIIEKHGLKFKNCTSFCADNAPVNFGESTNNIFYKLKAHNKNIVPIGCAAHSLHNAARHACDNFHWDIETIVFKLSNHFSISTLRSERLKELCDIFETKYNGIPTHGKTRWTTLLVVIEKMLKLWGPLTQYFSEDGPLLLRNFFGSDDSEIFCLFLQHILPIFNEAIEFLEREDAILPEMIDCVQRFKSNLNRRLNDEFFGIMTKSRLSRIDPTKSEHIKDGFLVWF